MFRLKIKEVAEARGVNRSQLSRRSDLALTTINELWDGSRRDVRMSTLAVIARALHARIEDLYEEVENNGTSAIIEDDIETTLGVAA